MASNLVALGPQEILFNFPSLKLTNDLVASAALNRNPFGFESGCHVVGLGSARYSHINHCVEHVFLVNNLPIERKAVCKCFT